MINQGKQYYYLNIGNKRYRKLVTARKAKLLTVAIALLEGLGLIISVLGITAAVYLAFILMGG